MITLDELNEILSTNGIEVPDYMAQCIVDTVNQKEKCLIDKGLSECIVKMCQILAAQLLASNLSSGKVVQSESVDVVRVSYKVESASDSQKGWYNQLISLGGFECFEDVISPPVGGPYGFAFVGVGCK